MTDADIERQAKHELGEDRPASRWQPIGVDRGPALPDGDAEEIALLGRLAFEALAATLDVNLTPSAVVLDPSYFPEITGLLGLPVKRRPLLGYRHVEIEVEP